MNKLEDEFGTYEQALALNKLGFDEECLGYYTYDFMGYNPNPYFELGQSPSHMGITPQSVKAPLKSQIFKFFREKYGLEIILRPDSINTHKKMLREYVILSYDKSLVLEPISEPHWWTREGCFKTPEEAENACIDKLIELAKQQDNDQINRS